MSAVAVAAPQSAAASADSYAAQLYERYSHTVHRVCVKELRRREDADDAVQMTFVYALLSLRRGVVPQLELPWLLTIARNVCSTRRRSRTRTGQHESPQDLDALEHRLATPERSTSLTLEDLRSALAKIPEGQRKALLLREWRGLSYEEIGSELGLSQAATEALLFRARRNVADRLAPLRPLHGLPLVSFLRNLLPGAAAKTVALGAGAALTIAAVPAAERDVGRIAPQRPAAVITTAPQPHDARPVSGAVRRPATRPRHVVSPRTARPAPGSSDAVTAPASVLPSRDVTKPAPSNDASPSAPEPQTAAAVTPTPTATPAPTPDPVTGVVETATDIVAPLEDVAVAVTTPTLPTVTVPSVTVPPLPVEVPALPRVDLP